MKKRETKKNTNKKDKKREKQTNKQEEQQQKHRENIWTQNKQKTITTDRNMQEQHDGLEPKEQK